MNASVKKKLKSYDVSLLTLPVIRPAIYNVINLFFHLVINTNLLITAYNIQNHWDAHVKLNTANVTSD